MNLIVAEIAAPGVITVEADWSRKEQIKEIPGSRWNGDDKIWTVPLTWASCLQLRGIFGVALKIGEGLAAWANLERKTRVDAALELRTKTESKFPAPWADKLYGFQRAGVEFLVWAGSALLTDEMGTGKTIQMLSTIRALDESTGTGLPALVVCPNTLKRNWAAETKKWLPQATPYVVAGSAVQRRKTLALAAADPTALVIINFESVRAHSRTAGFGSIHLTTAEKEPKELNSFKFQVIAVDEAHRIKDGNAKQTRSIWAIGQDNPGSRNYAMTGTPVANNPDDLWAIMHFVSPKEYPTKSKFVSRYCQMAFNGWGGLEINGLNPATKAELEKFFHPRMRRMPKALVLSQLPGKVYSKRFVEMDAKQAKAYHQIADGLVTRLDDGSLMVAQENIVANTRMLQFSSAYMESQPDGSFKMCDPSPKVDAMMEVIGEMGGKQLVVAAISRQLIGLAEKRLEKAGISFGRITGDTSQMERDIYITQFQKGELQVMLLTMQAGGVGITLTAADTILFLQRSWSMVENLQTVDRVHRIGAEKHQQINVIDLVTVGTIEESQIVSVWEKEQKLQQVVQDAKILELAAA